MKLSEFKNILLRAPSNSLRVVLPDGDVIPAEFHVTEVGHVAKNFIDCGGTIRSNQAVVLQTWVSDSDKDHRLTAGKLSKILDLSRKVVPSDDLPVEIEYEACAISQYPVAEVTIEASEITITLEEKHTDCLAKESCGVEASGCGCGSGTEGKCC